MRQGSEAAAGEAFVGSCRARASGLDDDGEWLMGMLNNGLGLDLDIWALVWARKLQLMWATSPITKFSDDDVCFPILNPRCESETEHPVKYQRSYDSP